MLATEVADRAVVDAAARDEPHEVDRVFDLIFNASRTAYAADHGEQQNLAQDAGVNRRLAEFSTVLTFPCGPVEPVENLIEQPDGMIVRNFFFEADWYQKYLKYLISRAWRRLPIASIDRFFRHLPSSVHSVRFRGPIYGSIAGYTQGYKSYVIQLPIKTTACKPDDFGHRKERENQAAIKHFLRMAAEEAHGHHKCHDSDTSTLLLLESLPSQKRPRNPADSTNLIVMTFACLSDEEWRTQEYRPARNRCDVGHAVPARQQHRTKTGPEMMQDQHPADGCYRLQKQEDAVWRIEQRGLWVAREGCACQKKRIPQRQLAKVRPGNAQVGPGSQDVRSDVIQSVALTANQKVARMENQLMKTTRGGKRDRRACP
jgi:hypothetical protein